MYKSSSFTFLFKYIIPGANILVVIFLLTLFFGNENTVEADFYIRQPMLLFMLASCATTILFIKIQSAEATEEHILVKIPFSPTKIIQYEDIEWVYQIALLSPSLTVVKYKDKITKKHHWFLITSVELNDFGLGKDNEMTQFIRSQIMLANPNYKKENEPNKWKPMIIVFGTLFLAQIILFNIF